MARANIISSSCRSIIGYWFHHANGPFHSHIRFSTFFSKPICAMAIERKNGFEFQGGRSLPNYFKTWRSSRRGFRQCHSLQGQPSTPPSPSELPPNISWIKWIVGIIISVILPSLSHKWYQLLQLKHEVDTVVETADEIIDVIEVVAEKVEEVAEEVAMDLPEGGKFRNAVENLEDAAQKVAKEAHTAGEFLDKVEDIEEKIDEIVKPVKHQG